MNTGIAMISNLKEIQIMKLFQVADRYCKESNWKTLALLKICLFSIGVMIGMLLPNMAAGKTGEIQVITLLTGDTVKVMIKAIQP